MLCSECGWVPIQWRRVKGTPVARCSVRHRQAKAEDRRKHGRGLTEEHRNRSKTPYDGVTRGELRRRLAATAACAICGGKRGGRFEQDHCHETGRVRDILCGGCNTGLGRFDDDPILLRAAADYIERWRAAAA